MLTSIFEYLVSALGELLDWAIAKFLEVLNMNLSAYLEMFPLLDDVYNFAQKFAMAMLLFIAGRALALFWTHSITGSNLSDRPAGVLLRTLFGAIAIYEGGYILEFIVRMGTIPYTEAMNLNAGTPNGISRWVLAGAAELVDPTGVTAAADLTVVVFEFAVLILITINLFKLVIEVCERYLMVGILVFTSPIIYSTVGSSDTFGIFKKWASMFVGSVLQMSISVIFLKLIISGLQANARGPFILQLIMILAMCKIAQRVDTYLQQIGIGVATTGGNMVDDFVGLIHSMGRFNKRSSSGAVGGGPVGGAVLGGRSVIGRGISAATSAYASGKGMKDSWAAAKGAAAAYMKQRPTPGANMAANAANAMSKAKADGKSTGEILSAGAGQVKKAAANTAKTVVNKDGLKQAANDLRAAGQGKTGIAKAASTVMATPRAVHTAAAGARSVLGSTFAPLADSALMFMNPSMYAQRDMALQEKANADSHNDAVQEFAEGTKKPTQEEKDSVRDGNDRLSSAKMEENRQNFGVMENGSPFVDDGGSPEITDAGKLAGLKQDDNGTVTGNPDAVGDFLAAATDAKYVGTPAPKSLAEGHGHDDAYYKQFGLQKADEALRNDQNIAIETNRAMAKGLEEKAVTAENKVKQMRAQNMPQSQIKEAEDSAVALRREANEARAAINTADNHLQNAETYYPQVAADAEAAERKRDNDHYSKVARDAAQQQRDHDMHLTTPAHEQAIQRQEQAATEAEARYQQLSASGKASPEALERARTDAETKRSQASSGRAEINAAKARLSTPDYYATNSKEAAASYRASDRAVVGNENRKRVTAMEADAAAARQNVANLEAGGAPQSEITAARANADQLASRARAERAKIHAAEDRLNPNSYYQANTAEAISAYRASDNRLASAENSARVQKLESNAQAAQSKVAQLERDGAPQQEITAAKQRAETASRDAAVARTAMTDAQTRLSTPGYYEAHPEEAVHAYRDRDRAATSVENRGRITRMDQSAAKAEQTAAKLEASGASVPEVEKARGEAVRLRSMATAARTELQAAETRLAAGGTPYVAEASPYSGKNGSALREQDQALVSASNRERVAAMENSASLAEGRVVSMEAAGASAGEIGRARSEATRLRSEASGERARIQQAQQRLSTEVNNPYAGTEGKKQYSRDQSAVGLANRSSVMAMEAGAAAAEQRVEELRQAGAPASEIATAQENASGLRASATAARTNMQDAQKRLISCVASPYDGADGRALKARDEHVTGAGNLNRISGMEAEADRAEQHAAQLERSGAPAEEVKAARQEAATLRASANDAKAEVQDAHDRLAAVERNPYSGPGGQAQYEQDRVTASDANRAQVEGMEAQAKQAERNAEALEANGASPQQVQAARSSAKQLRQNANNAKAEIAAADQRLGANDYYSTHPGEAAAHYKSADQYAVGEENAKRVEGLKGQLDRAEDRLSQLEESGAPERDIARARQARDDARDVYERESGAVEEARSRLGYQKWYSDYGENVADNTRAEDRRAYDTARNIYQASASDVIARTIEAASPYEIDRALSNINHEYGNTVHTRAMGERVFRDAIPDLPANSSIDSFRAYNLPNRVNTSGETIFGGRTFEIGYTDAVGQNRSIQFYDQRFFDSLPDAEKDKFRQFTYADGRAFYFRGVRDIESPRTGKQIIHRIKKRLGR